MPNNKLLQWQEDAWQSLLGGLESLPHALLLIGPGGTGKGVFAEQVAARLLCETAEGSRLACGKCEGCHLLASGNHPDFRKITLEEASDEEEGDTAPASRKSKKKPAAPATQIKIDQIRMLEEFVYVGSHRQGKRIVVIDPAEAMNVAATNSLLKILEEPPSTVYFLLVSSNPKRLLPTLRSRCRQMAFAIPDFGIAAAWLKAEGVTKPAELLRLAGGAPIKALRMHQEGSAAILDEAIEPLCRQPLEPIALAAHWEGLRRRSPEFLLEHLVDIVQKWLCDLARVVNGIEPRYLSAWQKELGATAANASIGRLNRCYADMLKIRATARHPLNELLFLEDMAARCVLALARPKGS